MGEVMFIEVKNVQRETILMNAEKIEYVLLQADKDVFVKMSTGENYKLAYSEYENLRNTLMNL